MIYMLPRAWCLKPEKSRHFKSFVRAINPKKLDVNSCQKHLSVVCENTDAQRRVCTSIVGSTEICWKNVWGAEETKVEHSGLNNKCWFGDTRKSIVPERHWNPELITQGSVCPPSQLSRLVIGTFLSCRWFWKQTTDFGSILFHVVLPEHSTWAECFWQITTCPAGTMPLSCATLAEKLEDKARQLIGACFPVFPNLTSTTSLAWSYTLNFYADVQDSFRNT